MTQYYLVITTYSPQAAGDYSPAARKSATKAEAELNALTLARACNQGAGELRHSCASDEEVVASRGGAVRSIPMQLHEAQVWAKNHLHLIEEEGLDIDDYPASYLAELKELAAQA